MADHPLGYPHVFAGNPLNRASEKRGDADWLAAQAADPNALAVLLADGQPLLEPDPARPNGVRLAYLSAAAGRGLADGAERWLFLGLWRDTPVFAVDLEGASPAEPPAPGASFEDLRGAAMRLPAADAAMVATAKAMFEWRRRHRFCANCGQPSEVRDGGWKRVCPACHAEHFPRTDPVVIMLATHTAADGVARCLVGRQAMWPAGMWSALAGFVEPGESLEEACARELKEEAGVTATAVRYHSTQPWPYPSSIMVGLIAEVAEDEAEPDLTELEAVRWFTRPEARDLLAGQLRGAFAPPPLAIAHHLIRSWAETED